jgi:hypothetical protein
MLVALQEQLQDGKQVLLERKMSKKYRMVKFFGKSTHAAAAHIAERQKVERRLAKAKKELQQATNDDERCNTVSLLTQCRDRAEKKVKIAEADLNYIQVRCTVQTVSRSLCACTLTCSATRGTSNTSPC